MSKTEEELWSRFLVTNYEDLYFDNSDILSLLHTYDDLEKIFQTLEIRATGWQDTEEVVIKNCEKVLRKFGRPLRKITATKWQVAETDLTNNIDYDLIFNEASGNFWLSGGYFFYFSEGFSTMAGVIFKKDDQDRPIMQILLGEQAYEVYQQKKKQHQWDSINRRLIR